VGFGYMLFMVAVNANEVQLMQPIKVLACTSSKKEDMLKLALRKCSTQHTT